MTIVYVFELNENKYYITEFKNDVIEPIKEMVKKLVSENDFEKSCTSNYKTRQTIKIKQ